MRFVLLSHVGPSDPGGVATSARAWVGGLERFGHQVGWCHAPLGQSGEIICHRGMGVGSTKVRAGLKVGADVVVVHYVRFVGDLAIQLAEQARMLILNMRGNDYTMGVHDPDSDVNRLAHIASGAMTVNPHMIRSLSTLYPDLPTKLVKNMPNSQYGALETRPGRPIRLLGVWKWKKGLHVFMDALELAPELIGLSEVWGPLVTADQQLDRMRKVGLTYGGEVPANVTNSILLGASVIVVPSLVEGMPNVALEALASGAHLVCSRIPGLEELEGLPGVTLFQAGSGEELATILRQLVVESRPSGPSCPAGLSSEDTVEEALAWMTSL